MLAVVVIVLLSILPGPFLVSAQEPPVALPSREVRVGIISALKSEVERVDGDGLIPRASRPQSWEKTIALLKDEAARAETPEQFGRVLKRFDANIPNHHMNARMLEAFEPYTAPPWPFSAAAERIADERRPERYRIAGVSSAAWASPEAPQAGDEVLSVNGRAMSAWSDENFVFCKSPLRSQCERKLFENIREEMLSWRRPQPLRLRLRRLGRTWETTVPLPSKWQFPEGQDDRLRPRCGVEDGRYPDFEPAFLGFNACVFRSRRHPGVYALRIRSFRYEHDDEADIDSIQKELRHLYDDFWKAESGKIQTLIVDVMDNPGGTDPIGYYKLLFKAPFQEQYAQYKKLREFDGEGEPARSLWRSLWANDAWLAGLHKDGRWDATLVGAFLPIRPQFCADEQDCEHALFKPRDHGFNGRVLLLMNRHCVSSCVGFVYNIVDVLKARVQTFGEPDSADSNFARLALDVVLDPSDPRGFRTRLGPRDQKELDGALFREIVSVTRSTDARGRVISGLPQRIDVRVPARWDQSEEEWTAAVFAAALARADAGPR